MHKHRNFLGARFLCYLHFFAALHPIMEGKMGLAHFNDHDQWTLERPLVVSVVKGSFRGTREQSEVVFTLNLRRDPLFYQIVFVYPAALLYSLSPVVFLIPVESGEKSSVIVTLLLAQAVYMGAISEVLPASSKRFPIIAFYLGVSSLQMGIDTILTVVGKC